MAKDEKRLVARTRPHGVAGRRDDVGPHDVPVEACEGIEIARNEGHGFDRVRRLGENMVRLAVGLS